MPCTNPDDWTKGQSIVSFWGAAQPSKGDSDDKSVPFNKQVTSWEAVPSTRDIYMLQPLFPPIERDDASNESPDTLYMVDRQEKGLATVFQRIFASNIPDFTGLLSLFCDVMPRLEDSTSKHFYQ
jgi:hypothetical protein